MSITEIKTIVSQLPPDDLTAWKRILQTKFSEVLT